MKIIGLIEALTESKRKWMFKRAGELNSMQIKSEIWFLKQMKAFTNYKLIPNFVATHYIIDFVYYELAIEIDGSFHDSNEQKLKDIKKDKALTELGFKVIRVKAFDHSQLWDAIKIIEKYTEKGKNKIINDFGQLYQRIKHSEKVGFYSCNVPKQLPFRYCSRCKKYVSKFDTKIGFLCGECFKEYQREIQLKTQSLKATFKPKMRKRRKLKKNYIVKHKILVNKGKPKCSKCNNLAIAQIISGKTIVHTCKLCLEVFLKQPIDFTYLIKYIEGDG